LDMDKGTVADLFNRFVKDHSGYAWEIKDNVVNVFPLENSRDKVLNQMLSTTIDKFSIKEGRACINVGFDLGTTPEITKIGKANNITYSEGEWSGFYIQNVGRHFKMDFSGTTLKAILNRIVEKSPTARFWYIERFNDNKQIFKINLTARFESYETKVVK